MGNEIALEKVSFAATKGSNNAVFTGKTKMLAILDKFERQDNVGNERKPRKSTGNKAVERMQKVFRKVLKQTWEIVETEDHYDEVVRRVKPLAGKYTAKDILVFSMSLAQFQGEKDFGGKAGRFISALINQCEGKEFVVNTEGLPVALAGIGFRNTKNVTLLGNFGDWVGEEMKGGTLVVNGNVRHNLGADMCNGKIIVNGNTGNFAGRRMKKGKIVINGRAGYGAGRSMVGGQMVVNGSADDGLGDMSGGKITVKGDAGVLLGVGLKGGKISVEGRIGGIGANVQSGDIFQNGRQLVKDGKIIAKPINK